jgi:hypothetical protein
MNDEAIKTAFERQANCPDLVDLECNLALAEDDPYRVAAIQHLEGCPHCRAQMALLQDFLHAAPKGIERDVMPFIAAKRKTGPAAIEARPASRLPWLSRTFAGIAAAAVLLLVGVSLNMLRFRGPRPAAPPAAGVYRSSDLQAIAPTGNIDTAPAEFRWTAAGHADSYLFQVTEVDRTVVYQSHIRSTAIPVSPEIAALMQPGKALLWKVTALDAEGNPIQESTPERFRISLPDK